MNDILAALNRERYGPSLWWHAPTRRVRLVEVPRYDNSDEVCARRRAEMAADFKTLRGGAR